MKGDRLTLKLEGEVPLDLFASAVSALNVLIRTLTSEVAEGAEVEWVVEDLAGGSAYATIVGQSNDFRAVTKVVEAYDRVGIALQRHEPIPFSETVRREAQRIVSIIDGKVSAVVLQDHTVTAEGGPVEIVTTEAKAGPDNFTAYGAVEGRVQTLSSRSGLRFTLYDAVNDRAVQCHLGSDQHDMMTPYWDKQAIVQGLVTRDRTGRPIAIRQISDVQPVVLGDYRRARGILAGRLKTDEPPEVTVRRLRDAD